MNTKVDVIEAARVFAAVARRGSFSVGAADCGIPQPVASRRVAALEAHWGGRLFERTTRSVALTEFGRSILPAATRLLAAADELEAAAESARLAAVTVAVPDGTATAALARAVARAGGRGLTLRPVAADRVERENLLRLGGAAAAVLATTQTPDWTVPLGIAGAELAARHGDVRLSKLRPRRDDEPWRWARIHVQPEDDLDAVAGTLRTAAVRAGLSPTQIAVTASVALAVADALVGESVVLCTRAEAERWELDWAAIHELPLTRTYRLDARDRDVRSRIMESCGSELSEALGAPGGKR